MITAAFRPDAPAQLQWQARALLASAEKRLEAERAQLAPRCAVGLGLGIALWLALADPARWTALLVALGGVVALGVALGGRLGRSVALFALAVALGTALIWWRSREVATPWRHGNRRL